MRIVFAYPHHSHKICKFASQPPVSIINIFQIIISVLLIAVILLQQRGSGLSPVFGGGGSVYRTRRGLEKFIFGTTIVLSILFLATAFLNIIFR